jgi:hypothetical protein
MPTAGSLAKPVVIGGIGGIETPAQTPFICTFLVY